MNPISSTINRCLRFFALTTSSILIVVTLAGLAGCAQFTQKDRAHRLDQSVRLYVSSIRWGNFDTAAALTRVRQGEQPPLDRSVLDNLRVTAYSSQVLNFDDTTGEAKVTANFNYYLLNSGTIRNVSQTAVWYFDESAGSWFLDGSLPDFRR